ncbi:MAG TPA: hypothetical protein DCP97_04320, partial [Ruminococcaceae bacterium]|nr:hypothetical protein [Oscillospiraceae bacterium]
MTKAYKKIMPFAIAFAVAAVSPTTVLANDDIEGPTLSEIAINRIETSPKGEIIVSADAYDSDGIRSVKAFFQNTENSKTLSIELKETTSSSNAFYRYSGCLKIPENTPEGSYKLKYVILTDTLNNKSRYFDKTELKDDNVYLLNKKLLFSVLKDNTPPTITNCSLSSNQIKPDSKASVFLWAEDYISGVDKATLIFKSKSSNRKLFCNIDKDDLTESGYYKGELKTEKYQPNDSFSLYKAIIYDNAGNKQIYCNSNEKDALPMTLNCSFDAISEQAQDTAAPILKDIYISDKDEDEKDFKYLINIKAEDDVSGIEHISVRFKNKANGRTASAVLSADDYLNGIYSGWLNISKYEPDGIFELENVGLTDNAQNYQAYCPKQDVTEENHKLALEQSLKITVNSGFSTADKTAPVLKGIKIKSDNINI